MFLTVFILSMGIIGISLIGLGVQVFFSKNKKFPETRVGHNRNMRKRKIYCIKTQQKIIDKKTKKENNPSCPSCKA